MKRIAMIAFGLLLLGAPAQAQSQFRNLDRSQIELCDTRYMPARIKTWTRAGVDRLLPELLGASDALVHLYFGKLENLSAGEQKMLDAMTAEQRRDLLGGRVAVQAVLAQYLFTPPGTDKAYADALPPPEFLDELDKATSVGTLKFTTLPCGTVILGMSNGTRLTPDGQVQFRIEYDALAIGWYQRGVMTIDGRPGVRAWEAAVNIASGPNAGNTVRLYVFEYCGNISFVIRPAEVEQVVGIAPQPPQPIPGPQGLPGPQGIRGETGPSGPSGPGPPVVPVSDNKRNGFGCGPAKVYCWGPPLAAGLAYGLTRSGGGGQEPAMVVSLPLKIGGPGPRP